jgi:hypothetical protein
MYKYLGPSIEVNISKVSNLWEEEQSEFLSERLHAKNDDGEPFAKWKTAFQSTIVLFPPTKN